MSTDSTDNRSPFNIWWVVSGVLLAIVILALVVVLIYGGGPSGDNNANPTPAPTESADTGDDPPDTADPSTSTCDLDDSDQDIPTTGPEANWMNEGLILIPSSPKYGPQNITDSEWSCFAHSPTGALFAASHFVARIAGPEYESFVSDAAVQNEALDAWLVNEDPDTHQQQPGRVAQIAGFQYQSVEPDEVIVNIGARQGDVEAAFRVGLVWDDSEGTWKGDFATSTLMPFEIDLNDYTTWGASVG